jgi:hypothetical protein
MTPKTAHIVLVIPYSRRRVCSVDSSATNSWKLGATNDTSVEVRFVAGSSHPHVGANS